MAVTGLIVGGLTQSMAWIFLFVIVTLLCLFFGTHFRINPGWVAKNTSWGSRAKNGHPKPVQAVRKNETIDLTK
jgi:hypothetical protein